MRAKVFMTLMFVLLSGILCAPSEIANAVEDTSSSKDRSNYEDYNTLLPEEFENYLLTIWINSTEEAVARTLGSEKKEDYLVAKKTYNDYDDRMNRGAYTSSEVKANLGKLKLDADVKKFFVDFEDEVYINARNRFLYDTMSSLLEHSLEISKKQYIDIELSKAQLEKRCLEIKASLDMVTPDLLDKMNVVLLDCEKQNDMIKKNIDTFNDLFFTRYPNVEMKDAECLNACCANDEFHSFSKNDSITFFLQNDITYVQMQYNLEKYKSHMDKFERYMRVLHEYKKEADREQAEILYMTYSLETRREMIETYVSNLLAQYETLEREMRSAEKEVEFLKNRLQIEQKKYGLGFSTKLLVFEKEVELRKAEYNLKKIKVEKIKTEFVIERGLVL